MDPARPLPIRIRLAREMQSLTKEDLAGLLGVSAPTIASIEASRTDATPYVHDLVQHLKQPLSFFFLEANDIGDVQVAFRSLRTTREKVKRAVTAKAAATILNIDTAIGHFATRPTLSLVDFASEDEGIDPQDAAQGFRLAHDLGRRGLQDDLLSICERLGVRFYWYKDDTEKTVGMSFWWKGCPYIFLKNSDQTAERDNWTIGHELGHLLLHRNVMDVEAHPTANDEADTFARALLLPQGDFVSQVPPVLKLEALIDLKAHYRVSLQAIVRTMRSYDLISESQYRFSFKRFNELGYMRRGPQDRPQQTSSLQSEVVDQFLYRAESLEDIAKDIFRVHPDFLQEAVPAFKSLSIRRAFVE